METEALGKQEVLGLVFGRGIVAGCQEVMGSGMGRGRPSAEGADSKAEPRTFTPPGLSIPHPLSSSAFWGCSVKRLLSFPHEYSCPGSLHLEV